MKKYWRLWAKAIGEKSGNNDSEANAIAIVRTFIITQAILTNIAIVIGVIVHFYD